MRKRLALIVGAIALATILFGMAAAGQSRRADSPIITPAGGTYGLNVKVRVSIRGEPGSRIIYTLDGQNPDHNCGIRTEANVVFFDLPPGDVTVKAAAVKPGFEKSIIRRADFVRK